MNVLLLDPPWRQRIFRDCFCTSIAKADYGWHPADLLAQSGLLREAGMTPVVLDAAAECLAVDEALRRARGAAAEAVFALSSPLSAPEDEAFLAALPRVPTVVTGEEAAIDPGGYLQAHPAIDAVLWDFTSPALAEWLGGERDPSRLPGLSFRADGRIVHGTKPGPGPFRLPWPVHDAFPRGRYRMPALGRDFATLVTDFGCPHRCALCNSGALGHRLRDPASIASDLDRIRALGFRRVFVKAMSFGTPRAHALEVCGMLSRAGMAWTAYVRPDVLDGELAVAMARSGCRRVRMGVESGDEALRRAYGKPIPDARILEAGRAARDAGLEIGVHLVVGLPGEGPSTLLATRALLRRLDPDDLSINLPAVRRGSRDQRAGRPVANDVPAWLPAARTLLYAGYLARPAFVARTFRAAIRDGEVPDLLRDGWTLLTGRRPGR